MSVVLINPNSTVAMTRTMLAAARAAAPGQTIEGWTSHGAPPAIQGPEDGAAAEGPLLDLVRKAVDQDADAIIIGCFDDTALMAAQRLAPCPVIGIGQAAFHACAMRGWRFGVVTTLPVSVPIIEGNIAAYGLSGACARVRASDVPVLDLEHYPERAAATITAEAQIAVREDGIDAIVLGCAGMTRITETLRSTLPVRIVDPIEAAITCIPWLVGQG
ncbi:aspartate/glutamate racemase family protein [Jannaschia sp. 2305UL9-9]|uniref:aspartate/glutamate racemase family protein n=1 Tax=Jannaschia sp. 2305UL9-9 TaxID=3121638 RepID=UPI0035284024